MSEDELLSVLNAPESLKESEKNFDATKPKMNFSKARIEKIKKEFNELRHKFSKSKINETRRNLYEIENEKNLFALKIKEIRTNLLELEEYLFTPKIYYDFNDIEYKGIRDVKDLYKPIIINGAFSSSYIYYDSLGDKVKTLSIKKHLDKIRPIYIINTIMCYNK